MPGNRFMDCVPEEKNSLYKLKKVSTGGTANVDAKQE